MSLKNGTELDTWMKDRMRLGHDMYAIKGPPKDGMCYSDGTPITRPVNVGWLDSVTGDIFTMIYEDAVPIYDPLDAPYEES